MEKKVYFLDVRVQVGCQLCFIQDCKIIKRNEILKPELLMILCIYQELIIEIIYSMNIDSENLFSKILQTFLYHS